MTQTRFRANIAAPVEFGRLMEEGLLLKTIFAALLFALTVTVAPAFCADLPAPPPGPPGQYAQSYGDPLAPFNEKMFWFNLKLDKYVLHPVASGYAFVLPKPARESVGNFFNNVNFIPRAANNLFQLKMANAGGEVARFGINSTLGVAGLFDVADSWFGLKQHDDDMGLTLGHYGVGSGAYIVWPFLGPATVRDTVGFAADSAMWPLPYFVPWYVSVPTGAGKAVIEAVNYRSLHLNLFEDVDRYAIDLYGAVQDGYMQKRAARLQEINAD
jgi:phospholipid-binding lipoprotein MlaA